jgi:zinc protease
MRCRRVPFLALLITGLAAAPASSGTPHAMSLPNGLRVLLAPDSGAAAVDVGVWYRAGLTYEPAGRSGLTGLVERLMFRGSPHVDDGEYTREMAKAGMSFNTFLAPDFSCFYSSGPARGIDTALRLEADRMAGLRLTPAKVAAERAVIAVNRKRRQESPPSRALQLLYATAFAGHPYAASVQGRGADAERLTAAACTEYAQARYGPGNAFVTVTGAFDPATAEAAIRRTFGAIPRRDAPPAPRAALPAAGERRARVHFATPVAVVMAGWRAPEDSACGAELEVLARALSVPGNGRLDAKLKGDAKLALTTDCAFDGRRQASLFYVTAAAVPGADSAALEEALIEQVEKLAREPLSTEELEQARKSLLIESRLDRDGARGRAQALGSAEMTDGGWARDAQRLARLEALQAEDVRRVAESVLKPELRTVVWVLPEKSAAKGGRP